MDPFIHVWDVEDNCAIQFAGIVVMGLLLLAWMQKIRGSWKKNGIKD